MAKKQIGEVDYNVEFNDSVLSTQTWNNPRYNGSKTETQVLNKYTAGDTTYGTKTAVQKYTRNIYVGDYITACSGSDDPNLVPFPDFSYLMSTKYITVNEDDTVEEKRFRAGVPDEKRGFYRSFLEDFTPGTKCQVYLLNEGVNNSLDDGYFVYFADGRLKQHLLIENSNNNNITITSTSFRYGDGSALGTKTLSSENLIPTLNVSEVTNYFTDTNLIEYGDLDDYFDGLLEYNDENPGENRFFLTIVQGQPYNFLNKDSIKIRINRRALKTYEIQKPTGLNRIISLSDKFGISLADQGGTGLSDLGYIISLLNNSIPSILVNLPKYEHLPNGLVPGNYVGGNFIADPSTLQGPKFVIIPENIHPYIKDNIKYFLIKAGLMTENQNLTLNTQNRQLL